MFEQAEQKISALKKEISELEFKRQKALRLKVNADEDKDVAVKLFLSEKKELDKLFKKKNEILKDLSVARSEIGNIDKTNSKALSNIQESEEDLSKRLGEMSDKEMSKNNLLRTIKKREVESNNLFAKAEQANVTVEECKKKIYLQLQEVKSKN